MFEALEAELKAEEAAAAVAAALAKTTESKQPAPKARRTTAKRRRNSVVANATNTSELKEEKLDNTETDNPSQLPKGPSKARKAKPDGAEPGYYPLLIRNYVGNFYLDVPVNLWATCTILRGRCSLPWFTSSTVKSRLPSITFEIFENGNIGVTGASSPYHAVSGMWQFCHWMSRIMRHKVMPRDFKMHNIVGSVGLGYALNLNLFFDDYRATATYNPEKFPGLHYHMESPRLVFLLYKSGKMVITQGRETTDLLEGFKKIDWTKYRVGFEYRELDNAHRRTRLSPGEFATAMQTDESGHLASSIQRLNQTASCECEEPQWVPANLQTGQWMCLVCSTIAHLKAEA